MSERKNGFFKPRERQQPTTTIEQVEDTSFTAFEQQIQHLPSHRATVPHLNKVYDTVRSSQAWRHTIDNYAHGTISPTGFGLTTTAQVSLINPVIGSRLMQWPGAVNLYLVLHSFSIHPQIPIGNAERNIAAVAGPITVTGSSVLLMSAIVTATGTTNLVFTDGSGGDTIGIIPSTATVGQVFPFNMPAPNGIVALSATTTPVVTIGYQYTTGTGSYKLIECTYLDSIGGYTIGLGELDEFAGVTIWPDLLIPSPIADPGIQNVGQLNILSYGSGPTYYWQMNFGYAYLLPTEYPHDIVEVPDPKGYYRP